MLRIGAGDAVSYTDGAGTVASGVLGPDSVAIERGDEIVLPRPGRIVHLVVAPPRSRDRQRWLVEKVSEIGVASIAWLIGSKYGQTKPPRSDRCQQWADAALEQSRGSHRTIVLDQPVQFSTLPDQVWFADVGGDPVAVVTEEEVTVVVGPEGGWADDELDSDVRRLSFGHRILRVETAAVVAAILLGNTG